MNKINSLIPLVSCILLGLPAQAQSCEQLLFDYLDTMQSWSVQQKEGDKVFYVEYTVVSEFSEETLQPNSKSTTSILVQGKNLRIEDSNMKIYGDSSVVFVILPKLKKLYINDFNEELLSGHNSYQELLKVQETLIKSAKEITCRDSGKTKIINIVPSKKIENQLRLKSQIVNYDLTSRRVLKVENQYGLNNPIRKQTIIYSVLEYNSQRLIPSIQSYLFDNGEIKSEFSEFEVIDNRNLSR